MQQDTIINSNYVMAEFYICASELEFDKINDLLGIANYKTRKKDSFSVIEFAKDYWSFDTGYEQSNDINIQIEKIYRRIENKVKEINFIKKTFNAESGFLITVKQGDGMMLPAIYFENEFINVAASINANINFDFT